MTAIMPVLAGVAIPPLLPGSAEWLRTMSASKIAAVVGLSPYESPFSLWHKMAGSVQPDESDAMRRGHFLEQGVADWFAHEHPDWQVVSGGQWAHADEPLFTAAPDRELWVPDGAVEGLEIKTSAVSEEWGQPGTGEVPVYYRAQCMWQMYVRGTRRTHVAVLLPFLTFASYVIDYDEADALTLADAARAFMDSLPGGPSEERPSIDAHSATYDVIKALPAGVIDEAVEITPDLTDRYLAALADHKAAEVEKRHCTSLVLDLIGDRKHAECAGTRIATRTVRTDGTTHSLRAATPKKDTK